MTARTRPTPRYSALVGGILLLAAHASTAADVYVVRIWTDTVYSSPTICYRVGWRDHLVFRNTTGKDLTVRALSVSNGYQIQNPEPLVVPAHRIDSVLYAPRTGESANHPNWTPALPFLLLVNRLDVPEGIVTESRAELWGPGPGDEPLPCPPGAPGVNDVFGSISLPVVKTLTPAGLEHLYLAADNGSRPQRTNIGVFNGGTVPANVRIELRRSCDNAVVAARNGVIASNTVTQFVGLADPGGSGCTRPGVPEYSRYAVVAMDQPGFSFVTSLAGDVPPRIAITSAMTR